jgi:hypothetical protein
MPNGNLVAGIDPASVGLELRLGRLSRENVETKGRRYLLEGRLIVREVIGDRIRATCRGSGSTWRLGFLNDRWYCECPARTRCSHLVALQLVTQDPYSGRDE